jgi:hypothetical protein
MLKAELFSDADQLQGMMLFTSRAAKNGMHTGFGLERRCRKSARISGCVADNLFREHDSIHFIMGSGIQQQHARMTALFFINDPQIIPGTDGTKPAQLPCQSMVTQHGVKGLIHEECQCCFHPPLVSRRQSGKSFVEPTRRLQRHGRAWRR